jgi:hypothetical protein
MKKTQRKRGKAFLQIYLSYEDKTILSSKQLAMLQTETSNTFQKYWLLLAVYQLVVHEFLH